MATDLLRYDLRVQDALRGVVRTVLADTARNGLPGDHHFFITFRTDAPGLRLSDRMRERYPEEMTIILQHQFWELAVTEQAFEVGLSFSNKPERLVVPFAAVTAFQDPSVQFALKFEGQRDEAAEPKGPQPPKPVPAGRTLSAVDSTSAADKGKGASVPALARPAEPAAPEAKPAEPEKASKPAAGGKRAAEGEGAPKVVSIDAFRKKP